SKTYYTQLGLNPLMPEDTAELLRRLLGNDASLRPLERIVTDRTEGNAPFVEETVPALVETGVVAGAPGGVRPGRAHQRDPRARAHGDDPGARDHPGLARRADRPPATRRQATAPVGGGDRARRGARPPASPAGVWGGRGAPSRSPAAPGRGAPL